MLVLSIFVSMVSQRFPMVQVWMTLCEGALFSWKIPSLSQEHRQSWRSPWFSKITLTMCPSLRSQPHGSLLRSALVLHQNIQVWVWPLEPSVAQSWTSSPTVTWQTEESMSIVTSQHPSVWKRCIFVDQSLFSINAINDNIVFIFHWNMGESRNESKMFICSNTYLQIFLKDHLRRSLHRILCCLSKF